MASQEQPPTASQLPERKAQNVAEILETPSNKRVKKAVNALLRDATSSRARRRAPEDQGALVKELLARVDRELSAAAPWNTLSAPHFAAAKEAVHKLVFSRLLAAWQTKEMRDADEELRLHIEGLRRFITPEFLGLDTSIGESRLLPDAAAALQQLDVSDTPISKLSLISDCANILSVVISHAGGIATADVLVPAMILVLSRCDCRTLHTNVAFLEAFTDPDERLGELFCYFMSFMLAITYIRSLSPGSALFRVSLSDELPPQLAQRITTEEYNALVEPIRKIVASSKSEVEVRAKGASVGTAIGAAVASPFAVAIGVLTIGLGAPISLAVLAAGATIGGAAGAAVPLSVQRQRHALASAVDRANEVLREKAVTLVSPFMTNRTGVASGTLNTIKSLEFIVRTLSTPQSTPSL